MTKITALSAFVFAVALTAGPGPARAAETLELPAHDWGFKGVFGVFDRAALRRGYQVYNEVCSACHSMKRVAFRNLMEIGFSEDEVKALAAEFEYAGPPDEDGEPTTRPGIPSDHFKPPFDNENAARAANNGALPPDLSLLTKARKGGPNYPFSILVHGYRDEVSEDTLRKIYAIENQKRREAYDRALNDYEKDLAAGRNPTKPEEPKEVKSIEDLGIGEDLNFNAFFKGYGIAMAPPLSEDAVDYADGTKASVEQMAEDVTTFIAWASEPEMEKRKQMGVKVILFMIFLTALLYALKRRIWARVH